MADVYVRSLIKRHSRNYCAADFDSCCHGCIESDWSGDFSAKAAVEKCGCPVKKYVVKGYCTITFERNKTAKRNAARDWRQMRCRENFPCGTYCRGCDCNVIHLDHFFWRPKQRTAERLQQAGGNVDYGRFLEEVLISLHSWVFSHKRVLRMERPIPSILWRRISGEGIR